MKFLLTVYVLTVASGCYCQFGQSDSVSILGGRTMLYPYQNRLKADLSLDAHRTIFQKKWIAIGGLKVGLQYRRIHKLGVGIYFLNTRIFDRDFEFDVSTDLIEYEFEYATIYYERVLYFSRRWEVASTMHLGGGAINIFYASAENPNERLSLKPQEFSLTTLSVSGEFHIFYWFTIGAGLGQRVVFNAPKDLRKDFSSPIFVTSVQVKFVKLVRSIFDDQVKYEY